MIILFKLSIKFIKVGKNISPKKKDVDDPNNKHVHIILKENRIEKFERIKAYYEHTSDVDAIRTCIDKTFEFLNQEPLNIRPELKQILEIMINNTYLKSKYLVFSFNDIINESLHQWIQSRRSELIIFTLAFRNELPSDEKVVAMVFIEHQINFENGMTITDIKNIITNMDETTLLKILKKFHSAQLIQINKRNNIEY